jgi:hypothetical protein
MDHMTGGFWRRLKHAKAPVEARAEVSGREPAVEPDDDADELHFCCICGALLGFDFEDEVGGEGPGRDICGACNRTKNDEAMMGF